MVNCNEPFNEYFLLYLSRMPRFFLNKQLILFVILLGSSLCLNWFYRPYIYANHIFDFYFADTFPSLYSVPTAYTFLSLFKTSSDRPSSQYFRVFALTLGFLIYELLELFVGGFDLLDIVATLLGTLITIAVVANRHHSSMKIFIPAVIVIESVLLFFSQLLPIPQWTPLLFGGILALMLICHVKKYSRTGRIVIICLSATSVLWSVYSSYCLPYWNSITFIDVLGKNYPYSKNANTLLTKQEAADDLAFCMRQIRKVHPACINGVPTITQNEYLKVKTQIDTSTEISVQNLAIYLQSLAATFADAHTNMRSIDSTIHYAAYSNSPEIISIDNLSFNQVLSDKKHLISSESEAWTKCQINDKIRSYEGLLSLGFNVDNGINVKYKSQDGAVMSSVYAKEDFNQTQTTITGLIPNTERKNYFIIDSLNTAYMKLSTCIYYYPKGTKRFKEMIRQLFIDVAANKCKALILDLRDNPGGNANIAFEFIKYLPASKYDTGSQKIRRGPFLFERKSTHKNKKYTDLVFAGKVYVLTSVGTFSAATNFANYLRDNNLCTIVGETSGNAVNCCTNMVHFVLPNSKLSLFISSEQCKRANQSEKNDFLIPDIECNASMALNLAIDNIKQKVN